MSILARTPRSVFACWDISDTWRQLLAEHFACDWGSLPFTVRLHDVTDVWFDGSNSHRRWLGHPSPETDNWYFHDLDPGRTYLADLGVSTDGGFFAVLRSRAVRTPADHCREGVIRFATPGTKVEAVTTPAPPLPTAPDAEQHTGVPGRHSVPLYGNEFDGYGALHPGAGTGGEAE